MASTIRDVAREAGVSVATVSRVINNSGPVHADTRRRIDDVAKRLRYIPNGAARTLSTRRAQTIGVVLPDLYGEFFSEVIRGIDQEVQRSGWHLLVSSSHNDRAGIEAALRAMRGRVDGLIVMSPDLDTHILAQNLPDKLPVVLLNCAGDDDIYNSLNIDNRGGAFAMTEHLLRQGHGRIGLITGPMRNHDARERLRGAHEALAAAGVTAAPELEVAGDFSEQSGHRAALELLELEQRPTALFAANDSMAIGALSALREAGVRVPEEMAIAGFDDIPIARYMSPPLTTVRVSISELGDQAARRLFQVITELTGERRQELLPTELVVRRSCGADPGWRRVRHEGGGDDGDGDAV
ncbi:MAG: LacI family DNA-binding transcriptional regulator [Gemmatimonadetes bacterium]|nr:LacI family DNA-binding transcriptional regulator [Gemmatimonadota bacterium]